MFKKDNTPRTSEKEKSVKYNFKKNRKTKNQMTKAYQDENC